MKRGRESPIDDPDYSHGIDIGSLIHLFGPNNVVFTNAGFTHLSFFRPSAGGPPPHRPVQFGHTTGDTTGGDILSNCSRSSPTYPLFGDYGPLYVLYVQKTDEGIKVVQKWTITAKDRDAMNARNATISSDSMLLFGGAYDQVPPTPSAGLRLLSNEQIMTLLSDPVHGVHIREMVSMAVAIRDKSIQMGESQLKKFK